MRAPVPNSQQATQGASTSNRCLSSTAENSPDIGDKFPGHTSPLRGLNCHHGLHTTSSSAHFGTSGQVAEMRPDLLFLDELRLRPRYQGFRGLLLSNSHRFPVWVQCRLAEVRPNSPSDGWSTGSQKVIAQSRCGAKRPVVCQVGAELVWCLRNAALLPRGAS